MRIDLLSLFPEMFAPILGTSILKRAADPALYTQRGDLVLEPSGAPVAYHLTDIRAYTTSKHGKVDDKPFGGGPGMVMQCQPLWDAVQAVEALDGRPAHRILMTPQGQPLRQPLVEELARQERLLVIAGHYEGIDQRVIEALAPLCEISLGDFVLSGGELPAMVLVDAVVRLIPGVLGDELSAHHESFSSGTGGMLDYPHYTRPAVWRDLPVPQVLLSGDHARIAAWRAEQSRLRTQARRPDLLRE